MSDDCIFPPREAAGRQGLPSAGAGRVAISGNFRHRCIMRREPSDGRVVRRLALRLLCDYDRAATSTTHCIRVRFHKSLFRRLPVRSAAVPVTFAA